MDDKTPILDTCEKVLSELQLITKQMECLPIISENLQKLLELQQTKPNDLQRTQSWSDIQKGWLTLSPTHHGQQNDVIHQTENHNTSQTPLTMNVPLISTTDKIFSGVSVETASNFDDITLNTCPNSNLLNLIELIDQHDTLPKSQIAKDKSLNNIHATAWVPVTDINYPLIDLTTPPCL